MWPPQRNVRDMHTTRPNSEDEEEDRSLAGRELPPAVTAQPADLPEGGDECGYGPNWRKVRRAVEVAGVPDMGGRHFFPKAILTHADHSFQDYRLPVLTKPQASAFNGLLQDAWGLSFTAVAKVLERKTQHCSIAQYNL